MKDKLEVLQHSLGLDAYGRGQRYRNHYCAGEGHHSFEVCMALVAECLMKQHKASALSGGSPVFTVTEQGIAWVGRNSPAPPKLTRSQKRYEAFLSEDGGMRFGEWLKTRGAVSA